VPDDIVSPTPRSKIRAVISFGASRRQNDTFVRFGNSSFASIGGPYACRSSCSSSPGSTSMAHCGLPIDTCWNRNSRPALVSVPVPSSGPLG
jgi:hypothetical protein